MAHAGRAIGAVARREIVAMTEARARAPTLAWLLTALTCLLVGIAIVEGRNQASALPNAPLGGTVDKKAAVTPAPIAKRTQSPTRAPIVATAWAANWAAPGGIAPAACCPSPPAALDPSPPPVTTALRSAAGGAGQRRRNAWSVS
jgi:hypothetical protein